MGPLRYGNKIYIVQLKWILRAVVKKEGLLALRGVFFLASMGASRSSVQIWSVVMLRIIFPLSSLIVTLKLSHRLFLEINLLSTILKDSLYIFSFSASGLNLSIFIFPKVLEEIFLFWKISRCWLTSRILEVENQPKFMKKNIKTHKKLLFHWKKIF